MYGGQTMKMLNRIRALTTVFIRCSNDVAAPLVMNVRSQSISQQVSAYLRNTNEGNAIAETALVLPILLTVIMGIYSFGAAFMNYQALQTAVAQGAQRLQSGAQYANGDPCQVASEAITEAAPNLDPAKIGYTLMLNSNGNPSASLSGATTESAPAGSSFSCSSAPAEAALSYLTLSATYPCNIKVYGVTVAPSCQFAATTTYKIQADQ
jgi:Flp pilus assembly protein TadG